MNLKQRVHKFWKLFLEVQKELEDALLQQNQVEVNEIIEHLNDQVLPMIGTRLEVERNENEFYELTIPCGGDRNVQLCAALLIKNAPEALKENWILNAWRPPLSAKAMASMFKARDKTYNGADIKVYYTINEAMKMLDVELYCEGFKDFIELDQHRLGMYFLELFIGELELEARINSVTILAAESDQENVCLLPNFYEDICDIIIDRDWQEYHDPTKIYTVYKLDETLTCETLRKDMKMIVTTHPQLQEELLNQDEAMCREMHERGADYGYLYYEVLYDDEKEALLRQQLEKEINQLLNDMSIASTIGGAIGIHYSYIDMIIYDQVAFNIAFEKINEKLTFPLYYKSFL